MTDPAGATDFTKIANGLMKAITTPTDQLAAKHGEGDLMVQIKRNSDCLNGCDRHEFERQPDWRTVGPLYNQKVLCIHCGGSMKSHDAMTYLRGYAHGAGLNYKAVCDAVWPAA